MGNSIRKTHNAHRLHDRLLAEAVSAWERIEANPTGPAQADAAAIAANGDLEHRIIVRARAMPTAPALDDALRQVRGMVGLIVIAGVVLAFVAGAAAAKAVLGSVRQEPVNFFLALGSLLGVQSAILLLWIGLMIASRRNGSYAISIGSLGGLLFRLAQFLARRFHSGSPAEHAAAIAATGSIFMRGNIGKWTLGAISNGLWVSFNVGCLIVMIALLSTRQYSFAWETTILSEQQYVPLTKNIAALPKLSGFPTPDDDQIRAAQIDGSTHDFVQPPEVRQAWSGLLIASVLLYGFGPRVLLLGLCLGQRRAAAAKHRLDTNRPEFLRLQSRLIPQSQSLGVIDPEETAGGSNLQTLAALREEHRAQHVNRPLGPPAVMAFEVSLSKLNTIWPPPVHGVRWLDLGFIDSRDDQHRVLRQLDDSISAPAAIVIVCSLTTTPDRGVGAFLTELHSAAAPQPLMLVLTGGEALRRRGDATHLIQRVEDWRGLATAAGIQPQHVIELDLEHLTQSSAAHFAALLKINPESAAEPQPPHRLIEQAFDSLAEHVERWVLRGSEPTAVEQAELHRHIARLYGHERATWRDLLGAPASLGTNLAAQFRASADRVVKLLPDRLRRSPKWLAAGAATGALACIAAASFIAPMAIAALPMWSGIGAALAGIIQPASRSGRSDSPDSSPNTQIDYVSALRSAALFALLLELQGRSEIAITRILDQIIDASDFIIDSTASARTWLDQLRHRLDIALAQEPTR